MTETRVQEIAGAARRGPAGVNAGFSATKSQHELTGLWTLMRFILRRDRVRLAVWTLSIIATYGYFVTVLGAMGQEALNARGEIMHSPAGIMMGGPGFGVVDGQDYTLGIAMANEMILWVVLTLGVMAIFHIVRHTRADEDTSRSELIRANVVGRHATAVAAFLTLVLTLVAIAVLGALAMHGANTEAMPLVDAFGMTLGVSAAALTFGAAATIFCQITEHPRGAIGMSMAFLGLMYVVRTAGDMAGAVADPATNGSLLSWVSPIAWAQQMRPFYDLIWWPVLLSLGLTVLFLAVSSMLATRRDYGLGMVAAKPGPADATASLRSPFALAWRQQRTGFWIWLVSMGVMWGATGTMVPDIADMGMEMLADNEVFGQIFDLDPAAGMELFAVQFMGVFGMFIALTYVAYAISTFNRLRTEETAGRLEGVLATPVSRTRVLLAQLAVTAIGTTAIMLSSMFLMWAGAASAGMDSPGLGRYLLTGVVYLAAIAVFVGFVVVLFGWAPSKTGLGWVLLGYGLLIGVFGNLFLQEAPEGVQSFFQGINPLYHAPAAFGGEWNPGGFVALIAVAAALIALGLAGFRRRDVNKV